MQNGDSTINVSEVVEIYSNEDEVSRSSHSQSDWQGGDSWRVY